MVCMCCVVYNLILMWSGGDLFSVVCGSDVDELVLFFKQKTAYEMRISDWSSDVCSSDLQFQDVIAGLHAMELPNSRHALDLIAHGDLRQQVRAPGFATRRHVPYTRHPGRTSGVAQIGRASCRARVWQYV